jgi:N-acetylglucosaminyldiphosphoundecaprenol N-acetyl-beta-D-mannosaminyltransferase
LLSVPDGIGVVLANEFYNRMSAFCEVSNKYRNFLTVKFKPILYRFRAVLLWIQLVLEAIIHPKKYLTVTGVDLVDKFCELANKKGYTILLLGGWPRNFFGKNLKGDYDVATLAAEKLKSKYPDIHIVGSSSKFSPHEFDDLATIAYIKDCMQSASLKHIDMLFISYGSPAQEVWLQRNFQNLDIKLAVGVGGSFDYISGFTARPPKFIRTFHFEWLYRLITQPYRLKRIINALFIFPLKVLTSSNTK